MPGAIRFGAIFRLKIGASGSVIASAYVVGACIPNCWAGPNAAVFAVKHSEAELVFAHADHRELFDYVRPHGMQVIEVSEAKPEGTLRDISTLNHALLMYA